MRVFSPGQIDVEGLDAVIHLAGESIFGYWSAGKKERILASRRDGTHALVDAILAAGDKGPKVLVSASAIGFYGETGEREVDESAPSGNGFLAEVTRQWEAEAGRARSGGVRVVSLRFGLILGQTGGAIALMRPLFLMGMGARLGSGKQWVSWIDVEDAAGLALFCLENPQAEGPINAVAPHPVRNLELTELLARKWHRKAWLSVPAPLIKGALGELSGVLLESQRVLPRRALELGYAFECPRL